MQTGVLRSWELLVGLASLDAGHRDRSVCPLPRRFGKAPAAGLAIQALLLFLEGLGRRIHQAEHLIHWLARLEVIFGKPAHTVVGAAVAVPPPIYAVARILDWSFDGRQETLPPLLVAFRVLARPVLKRSPARRTRRALPIIGRDLLAPQGKVLRFCACYLPLIHKCTLEAPRLNPVCPRHVHCYRVRISIAVCAPHRTGIQTA